MQTGARLLGLHSAAMTYKGAMVIRILRLGCLGVSALLASQAWADGCQLKDYGTLPVEMLGGRATTMVKINGNDTRFTLDTGAFFSTMSRANASSLGLKLRPAPFGFRISGVGGDANVQKRTSRNLASSIRR